MTITVAIIVMFQNLMKEFIKKPRRSYFRSLFAQICIFPKNWTVLVFAYQKFLGTRKKGAKV